MGNFISSIAAFCDKAKRFGKRAWKFSLVGLSYVGLGIVVLLGFGCFLVNNIVVAIAAPVWMPVAFFAKPQWLAELIDQPASNDPEGLMMEGRHLSVILYGWYWRWLGSRSWAHRKLRAAFIKIDERLAKYPTMVQVARWVDAPEKDKALLLNVMSEEARQRVLLHMLEHLHFSRIEKMLSEGKADKVVIFKSLLRTLSDMAQDAKEYVVEMFDIYFPVRWTHHIDASEKAWLYAVSDEAKVVVLKKFAMSLDDMAVLLKEEGGISVLRGYLSKGEKTLSKAQLSLLIQAAQENPEALELLKEIVLREGMSPELVKELSASQMSYAQKDEVISMMIAFDEKALLKGVVTDLNLSSEEQKAINIERWRSYCSMSSVRPEAQVLMDHEHYRIFAECGQRLCETALIELLSKVRSVDFFRDLMRDHYEVITDEVSSVIYSEPWKFAIGVEVAAEKQASEPIEL